MSDTQGYARSKTLAILNHAGYAFRLVRARFDGKPWRGYVCLVLDGVRVADVPNGHETAIDAAKAARWYARRFDELYPDDHPQSVAQLRFLVNSTLALNGGLNDA